MIKKFLLSWFCVLIIFHHSNLDPHSLSEIIALLLIYPFRFINPFITGVYILVFQLFSTQWLGSHSFKPLKILFNLIFNPYFIWLGNYTLNSEKLIYTIFLNGNLRIYMLKIQPFLFFIDPESILVIIMGILLDFEVIYSSQFQI